MFNTPFPQVNLAVDSESISNIDAIGASGGNLEVSSLFFVGGLDSATFTLPEFFSTINLNTSFVGCLDNIEIDSIMATLNSVYFVEAKGVTACSAISFVDQRSYVAFRNIVATSSTGTSLTFDFTTVASDGVLVYVGPSTGSIDFFSVYLSNGSVVVKYNLGSGKASVTSLGEGGS